MMESSDGSEKKIKQAVALKYDPQQKSAPIVAAKGKGAIAEAILAKAAEHGIPVQEDASLVEVLSKLDVEQEIPAEMYAIVAEVLSFIYRADREAGRNGDEQEGR